MSSLISNTAELEAETRRLALELPVDALASGRAELAVGAIVRRLAPLLDANEHDVLVRRVVARLLGLGPLEELLAEPEVTEVMINGPGPIWIERSGDLCQTDIELDRPTIDHLVERIVAPLGRRLDRTSPLVDGRLPDGSRVHVVAPPVALDGPYVTVRRFEVTCVELDEMATRGTAQLLGWAVRARANVLISGGTSSGKTTLLSSLARLIDADERLVTVEDAAELQLPVRHVVRLEARPASVDGPPPVSIRDLVRNALRMRPDRIIVGEVRGPEALDMLQAMNTGHEGSLSTCHANSPPDALARLGSMIAAGETPLPLAAARELLVAAIDLVVQVERGADGRRRVVAVAEPEPGTTGRVRQLADRDGLRALPSRPPRRPAPAPSAAWLESAP